MYYVDPTRDPASPSREFTARGGSPDMKIGHNSINPVSQSASHAPNPQKMNISELERQNAILKRAKESLQVKQINQKVKSDRKIDRLEKQIINY